MDYRTDSHGIRVDMKYLRTLSILLPLCLSACHQASDEFLQERAEQLCKANDCCADEELYYTDARYPDNQCVEHELDVLAECPDKCEYDEDAALKCIRAIRGIKLECDMSDDRFKDCKNVFTCEDPGDQEACNAKPIEKDVTSSCSVTGDSSPGLAWAILLLFGIRRQRC